MTTDPDNRSSARWLLGVMLFLAIPVAIIWWPGCREYPPVTSEESLKLMKLLYSACNTKNTARLTQVEERLKRLEEEGKLTAAERTGFDKIIGMAKAGQWQNAEQEAFRFAEDQVR